MRGSRGKLRTPAPLRPNPFLPKPFTDDELRLALLDVTEAH